MAHPVRKFKDDEPGHAAAAEPRLRVPVGTAEGADHSRSLALPTEAVEERATGYYTKRLALAGGASVVIASFVAGTPLAGLAVLGCAIALKKAAWAFGNYVLDHVL